MQITINTKGSRTLADTTPLTHDGQRVYVTVEGDTAYLHIAGRIADQRPAAEVSSIKAMQDWAYWIIESLTEAAEVAEVAEVAIDAEADVATVVEARGGIYRTLARELGVKGNHFTAAELAARIRHSVTLGVVAEIKDCADNSGWYVELSNGKGSSYGQYHKVV